MPATTTAAAHRNWSDVPVERIAEGIERQMIWGEQLMVCRLRFAPRVVTAVHTHPHEQITLVERGRVRFTVDGQDRIAVAGDVLNMKINTAYISQTNMKLDFNKSEDIFYQVNLKPGADAATAEQRLGQIVENYPQFRLVAGRAPRAAEGPAWGRRMPDSGRPRPGAAPRRGAAA